MPEKVSYSLIQNKDQALRIVRRLERLNTPDLSSSTIPQVVDTAIDVETRESARLPQWTYGNRYNLLVSMGGAGFGKSVLVNSLAHRICADITHAQTEKQPAVADPPLPHVKWVKLLRFDRFVTQYKLEHDIPLRTPLDPGLADVWNDVSANILKSIKNHYRSDTLIIADLVAVYSLFSRNRNQEYSGYPFTNRAFTTAMECIDLNAGFLLNLPPGLDRRDSAIVTRETVDSFMKFTGADFVDGKTVGGRKDLLWKLLYYYLGTAYLEYANDPGQRFYDFLASAGQRKVIEDMYAGLFISSQSLAEITNAMYPSWHSKEEIWTKTLPDLPEFVPAGFSQSFRALYWYLIQQVTTLPFHNPHIPWTLGVPESRTKTIVTPQVDTVNGQILYVSPLPKNHFSLILPKPSKREGKYR